MGDDSCSSNFAGFLRTMNLATKTAWKEIEATKDELVRRSRKRKQEAEELDFTTFPLTFNTSFELKDSKSMVTLLQNFSVTSCLRKLFAPRMERCSKK